MPKIINHEEIRKKIIEKAIPLFATMGYTGVNFTMLSEASGVRRTSLYKFFNDKEDLFLQVIDHSFLILESATGPALADAAMDGWEKIRSLCMALLKSGLSSRSAMVVILQTAFFMNQNEAFSANIRKHADYLRTIFATVLRQGMQSGHIRQHEPDNMAFAIVSLIEAFMMQNFLHVIDDSKVTESLEILLSGLRVAKQGPRPTA